MNKASDKIADLLKAKYDVKNLIFSFCQSLARDVETSFFLLFSFNGGVLFEVKISYV